MATIGSIWNSFTHASMFAARPVSKLLKLGTIVLVYDKVSFVSAKAWIENPKLKEAALVSNAFKDETDYADASSSLMKLRLRLYSTRSETK